VEFEAALKVDPQNAVAQANIGAIALRFRDYKRAVNAYGQANRRRHAELHHRGRTGLRLRGGAGRPEGGGAASARRTAMPQG